MPFSVKVHFTPCIMFVLITALLTPGCATVFNRHADNMDLTSEPTAAQVTLSDGAISCTTPCHLQFADKQKIIPGTISKRGYKSQEISIRRPIHWGFWVNLALGLYGLPGMGIDWLSGSMRGYRNLSVKLEKGEDDAPQAIEDLATLFPREKIIEKIAERQPGIESGARQSALDTIYQRLDKAQKAGKKIDLDAIITEVLDEAAAARPKLIPNAALQRMQERFPPAYVLETMRTYNGTGSKDEEEQSINGIYQQLLTMEKNGERLDLDEAIRRQLQGVSP